MPIHRPKSTPDKFADGGLSEGPSGLNGSGESRSRAEWKFQLPTRVSGPAMPELENASRPRPVLAGFGNLQEEGCLVFP